MPTKAQKVLSQPSRFKCLYGGRGSGKSYAFANALIAQSFTKKRFLCAREIQNSIRDSVYRLLCDRIYAMRLQNFFIIQKDEIFSKAGAEFIFKGIKKDISAIRSMEGIDVCWVEEAEATKEDSWDILLPTIRKGGSEIWASFNPDDERSSTFKQFVLNPLPDLRCEKVNYNDNDLFPDVLRREMEWCRQNDKEKFMHVWDGFPKKYGQAVIFKDKLRVETFEPPDEDTRFFFGADFGYGVSPTCLVRLFIRNRTLYIDKEFYGHGIEIDDLPKGWDSVPESRNWSIRCDNARPDTISYMCKHGFDAVAVEKGPKSIEDGIEFLKNFEAIIIDPDCKGSIGDFSNYRWKVDIVTDQVLPIAVDKSNDACDSARYALEPYMKNECTIFDALGGFTK